MHKRFILCFPLAYPAELISKLGPIVRGSVYFRSDLPHTDLVIRDILRFFPTL